MNTVYPSAGVYTKETDLSQRIAGVSSSIAAFVGAAPKGPVGERTPIFDTTDLELTFGKRDAGKFGFMLYCADAFCRVSPRAYVTRVVNGALTAGAYVTADDVSAATPILSINNFDNGDNVPVGRLDPINTVGFNPGEPDIENNLMFICAVDPGKWNNGISVRIRPSNPRGRDVGQDHNVLHFYIDVYYDYTGPNNTPVESFLVSRREGEVDTEGQSLFVEDRINTRSKYIRVKNNPHCAELPILTSPFEFLAGGTDGNPVTSDQIAQAWELYDDAENIDVNLLVNCGYATPTVQRKMVAVARNRFDAFAILDMPFDKVEPALAVAYRRNDLNINDSYGALYSPWLQVRDTVNNKKIMVPPSGHVAAAYARTDQERALWFAPAGLRRGLLSVLGLNASYKQGARDALDQAQINVIRSMTGRGVVIWGAETLQTTKSALSNVNVRRLINYIKKAISTGVAFGVFDPNDDFLRAQLKNISDSFLQPIKEGRGLYAYETVCDERNNTNDTIAAGDLMLDVYADPVIAVKQIHLTAHIQKTGTRYSE